MLGSGLFFFCALVLSNKQFGMFLFICLFFFCVN